MRRLPSWPLLGSHLVGSMNRATIKNLKHSPSKRVSVVIETGIQRDMLLLMDDEKFVQEVQYNPQHDVFQFPIMDGERRAVVNWCSISRIIIEVLPTRLPKPCCI